MRWFPVYQLVNKWLMRFEPNYLFGIQNGKSINFLSE